MTAADAEALPKDAKYSLANAEASLWDTVPLAPADWRRLQDMEIDSNIFKRLQYVRERVYLRLQHFSSFNYLFLSSLSRLPCQLINYG